MSSWRETSARMDEHKRVLGPPSSPTPFPRIQGYTARPARRGYRACGETADGRRGRERKPGWTPARRDEAQAGGPTAQRCVTRRLVAVVQSTRLPANFRSMSRTSASPQPGEIKQPSLPGPGCGKDRATAQAASRMSHEWHSCRRSRH